MKYFILSVLLILSFISCQKTSIVGTWTALDENTISDLDFRENATIDYFIGVFKSKETSDLDEDFEYTEGISKYELNNNVLKIYNSQNNSYNTYTFRLDKDTLVIIPDFSDKYVTKGLTYRYIQSDSKSDILFDNLIYYKPSQIGEVYSDPTKYYLTINDLGKMVKSDRSKYDSINVYQLSEKQIRLINRIVSKLDFYSKDSSSSKVYGLEAPSELTLVRSEKMYSIHSSLSNLEQSNILNRFQRITTYLSNTIEPQTEINKVEAFQRNFGETYFYYFRYNGDSSKCSYITYSEGFYLSMLLQKASHINIQFDEKFVLDSSYKHNELPDTELIYTDGRYYRYKNQIVDLGYNFLEKNGLDDSFVDKKDIAGGIMFEPPSVF